MTASAIYEGTVAHRRRTPVDHKLSYSVFMALLDLDELPELFDRHPLWSARRPAPMRFRASDYLPDDDGEGPRDAAELAARARELVADRTGSPAPPARSACSPRRAASASASTRSASTSSTTSPTAPPRP